MTSPAQPLQRICLTPRITGVSGMGTFQAKLAAGLAAAGIGVCYDLADEPYQAVLVIGGTSRLPALWRARRKGIAIVQRLDGMNWIQRVRRTGLRHFWRAEYGNLLLQFIRTRLATGIIYQSQFSKAWWERVYGPAGRPDWTILNGVDLQAYTPHGPHERPTDHLRVLLVEGNLGGGYELGLETAVALCQRLRSAHNLPVELVVAGQVTDEVKARWQAQAGLPLQFLGVLKRDQIPALDRSAHLLYSGDIHAACPNSVIEALACGLPVLAFDTGALSELVQGDAGRVVAYGGDAWKLDPPDLTGLASAGAEILAGAERFRQAARARAEAALGLETMVSRYLEVLLA